MAHFWAYTLCQTKFLTEVLLCIAETIPDGVNIARHHPTNCNFI